jgi:hypothetical protein
MITYKPLLRNICMYMHMNVQNTPYYSYKPQRASEKCLTSGNLVYYAQFLHILINKVNLLPNP